MAYIGDSQKQIVNIAPVTLDPSMVSVSDIPALDKIQENIQNNLNRLADKQQEIARALAELSSTVTRRTEAVDQVVNGRVEFPAVSSESGQHTGNINVSYADVLFIDEGSTGTPDPSGIWIDHNLGETPRGWVVVGRTNPYSGTWNVTDLVCNSDGTQGEQPLDSGNSWNTATAAAGTTISGSAATAGANGWAANGVVAGDQIKLWAHRVAAAANETATSAAGSTTVTGAGASLNAFTNYRVGWRFRYLAGVAADDIGWHTITAITSSSVMTVSPAFGPRHVGGALRFEVMAFDQSWRTITAVTAGAPETLTLSTATEVTATASAIGTAAAWCQARYIIRRPMTSTQAWFRIQSPGQANATACRIMFF